MNVADKVRFILSHSTAARNSDKRLMVYFMQKEGMNLSDEQIRAFYDMPSPETIRRTRQKIQEAGEYVPTIREVAERRKLKSWEMQQNMPGAKPEAVERIMLDV